MRKIWTYCECRCLLSSINVGMSLKDIHETFNGILNNRTIDALRSRRNALAKIGITTLGEFNKRYGSGAEGVMPSLKNIVVGKTKEELLSMRTALIRTQMDGIYNNAVNSNPNAEADIRDRIGYGDDLLREQSTPMPKEHTMANPAIRRDVENRFYREKKDFPENAVNVPPPVNIIEQLRSIGLRGKITLDLGE